MENTVRKVTEWKLVRITFTEMATGKSFCNYGVTTNYKDIINATYKDMRNKGMTGGKWKAKFKIIHRDILEEE